MNTRTTVEPRTFEVLVETPTVRVKLPRLRNEREVWELRAHGWKVQARQVERLDVATPS